MITVKLYQKKNKLRADGTAPIYYVLAKGRNQKLISAKIFIEPDLFDNATGLVLKGAGNAGKLNSFLRSQMTQLDNIIIDLINKGQEVSFEKIEQVFNNDYSDDFIAFAFDELSNQKGLIAFKTYQGYQQCLNNLKKYRTKIAFNAINHSFLMEYKHHMVTVEKRKVNGYYQDFATIKKFHRIAQLKGEVNNNPFANFKLGREETVKNWLTEIELNKLHGLLEGDKITDAVKNTLRHFLFSCYTGIRFGDKKKMTEQHVADDRLSIQTNKTKKHVTIPFNGQAKLLLSDVLNRKLKEGNNRVNAELELCMQEAKINKHVTYHCSRHSFAINCILLGIDIITVRDWLGHKSVTTTEIYAKIAQQFKDENMKKWDNFGKLKVA